MTQSIESGSNNMIKIVLIDDDAFVLRVHAEMLKAMGYVPFTFESPEDALKYLREYREHVSMVITDYRMPVMNGLEFISELRQFDNEMSAMILTGFPDEVDHHKVRSYGARLVSKPIKSQKMAEHIDSLEHKKNSTA